MNGLPTPPRHVLILEDEMLIALDVEQMLTELGHTVVALCTRVPPAMTAARDAMIDFAVLDMNIAGVPSFPVATLLRARGIPFVFLSGYGTKGLIEGFTDALVLDKPFGIEGLKHMVALALSDQVN